MRVERWTLHTIDEQQMGEAEDTSQTSQLSKWQWRIITTGRHVLIKRHIKHHYVFLYTVVR